MKHFLFVLLSFFAVQSFAAETLVFQASGEYDADVYPATGHYVFSKEGGAVSVSIVGREERCYPGRIPGSNRECVYRSIPIVTHQIPNLKFVGDVGDKGAIVFEAAGVEPVICAVRKAFGRMKPTGLCKLDIENIYDKKKNAQTYLLKYYVQIED